MIVTWPIYGPYKRDLERETALAKPPTPKWKKEGGDAHAHH